MRAGGSPSDRRLSASALVEGGRAGWTLLLLSASSARRWLEDSCLSSETSSVVVGREEGDMLQRGMFSLFSMHFQTFQVV